MSVSSRRNEMTTNEQRDHVVVESEKKKITISSMPEEVIAMIMKHLSVKDKANCALVCRKWRDACDDPMAWRRTTISVSLERAMKFADNSSLWASILQRQTRKVWITNIHNWCSGQPLIDQRKVIASLRRIPGLTSLTVFFRQRQQMMIAMLANLIELKICQSLEGLGETLITAELKNLVRLRLEDSNSGEITDVTLQSVCHHLKQLTHLTLSGSAGITDDGLRHLAADGDSPPPALEYLKVVGNNLLTDRAMEYVASGQLRLLFVSLPLTDAVTVVGLHRLARMPYLRTWQMQLLRQREFFRVNLAREVTDLTSLLESKCKHLSELCGVFQPYDNRALYTIDDFKTVRCRKCLSLTN